MFPLRDNIRSRTAPYLTIILIVVNISFFVYEASLDPAGMERLLDRYAIVPAQLLGALTGHASLPSELFAILSSMFLHGGLMHLAGNMWFLWIFGDNVEDRLGRLRFLLFYVATGTVAALSQILVDPTSPIPILGASGAIAGVLGAYLRFFPGARVQTVIPIFIFLQFIELPALVFLALWFFYQILSSLIGEAGVAWWAHIFGFMAGFLFTLPMKRPIILAPRARMFRH